MLRYYFLILAALSLPFHPARACNYPADPEMQSRKDNCVSASKEWSCRLNRCITTPESFQTREDFQQCEQLDEGAAKDDCFLRLAEEKTGVKRNTKAKSSGLENISVALSAGYALLGAISWFSKDGGGCLSKTIMTGGSIAHLATHFLILNKGKKKFDNIKSRIKSSGTDYNTQMRAFQLLKEEQEAIRSYAKKKETTYTIVTIAYAGATAVAILEKTGSFGLSPCEGKTTEEHPEGEADTTGPKKESPSSDILSQVKGFLSINSSTQVAIFSGIGMALSFKLRQAAIKEKEKAEKNIQHIDKIIAQFENTMARYCPKGREDMKSPSCYCYTDKGEPNPQRTKSTICQNLWKKDNINYAVTPGTYRETEGGPRGCLAKNGEFDPDCKCRKYKDTATGKNLCASTSTNIVIPSALQGKLSGVGKALKAANVLTGASGNGQALNSQALKKAAAKTRRYAEKLIRQYNRQAPSRNMAPLPLTPAFVEKAVKTLANARMQKRFGAGKAVAPLSSTRSQASPALAQAIKKIQQKKNFPTGATSYQKQSKKVAVGKKAAPFQWGSQAPSTPKGQTLHIKDGDKRHNKQKNADLHTNPEISIWKIISKRYWVSGLPSLFPEEP